MKKRKWWIPVCILGALVLTAGILLAVAGLSGWNFTVGRYYSEGARCYVIDDQNRATLVATGYNSEMFDGCENGDRVLVCHDGVNTSYPAETGGRWVIRLKKGDGTYVPEDEIIGVVREYEISVDFQAQYVLCYSDAFPDTAEYRTVDSVLGMKTVLWTELGNDRYAGAALEKYDADFFADHILLMWYRSGGSSSEKPDVSAVRLTQDGLQVTLNRICPEVINCDIAEWLVLVELPSWVSDTNVTVSGRGYAGRDTSYTYHHESEDAGVAVTLPYYWSVELTELETGFQVYLYCEEYGKDEGVALRYDTAFGVCGTGLTLQAAKYSGYSAQEGYYDGDSRWDHIVFQVEAPGDYVALNQAEEAWWSRYQSDVAEILDSLVLGISEDADSQS